MFFYSNSVNACLPSVSVDRHFSFPYFEKCGDNVVTFRKRTQKEKSLTA